MKVDPISKIDWDFIRKLEGFKSKGYVPDDKDGPTQSGVTIGAGFDIGQHSFKDLLKFKFSLSLVYSLLPYTNVTGDKARNTLKEYTLSLTKDQLDELDTKVRAKFSNQIEKEFNDNSDLVFCLLNRQQQTIIMSVGFQYGSLKRRCPKFFKLITKGKWLETVCELKNFGDAYPTRRKKEAALLSSSLKKGNKMSVLVDIVTDPLALTAYATFVGVVLVRAIWPKLEKIVKKTPTKTDDEWLEIIKKTVNEALAKKTKTKAKK